MKNKIAHLFLEYRYYSKNYFKFLNESNYFSYDLTKKQSNKIVKLIENYNNEYCYGTSQKDLKEGVQGDAAVLLDKIFEPLSKLFDVGKVASETGEAAKAAEGAGRGVSRGMGGAERAADPAVERALEAARAAEAGKAGDYDSILKQAQEDLMYYAQQRAAEGLVGEDLARAVREDMSSNEIFNSKDPFVRNVGNKYDEWSKPVLTKAEEISIAAKQTGTAPSEVSPRTPSEIPAKTPDLAPEGAPPTISPGATPEISPSTPSEVPATARSPKATKKGTDLVDEYEEVGSTTVGPKIEEKDIPTPDSREEKAKVPPKRSTATKEKSPSAQAPSIGRAKQKISGFDTQGKSETADIGLKYSNLGQVGGIYQIR